MYGLVVAFGLAGGLIRTTRDAFKRWSQKEEPWDRQDMVFDMAFGAFGGAILYLVVAAVQPDAAAVLTPLLALGLLTAGYMGADFIDPVLSRAGELLKQFLQALPGGKINGV